MKPSTEPHRARLATMDFHFGGEGNAACLVMSKFTLGQEKCNVWNELKKGLRKQIQYGGGVGRNLPLQSWTVVLHTEVRRLQLCT